MIAIAGGGCFNAAPAPAVLPMPS
ncbi:MAG: hypothetical protein IPM80_22020 [Proteobacteria bacterium]|nr:hypothetical protein [Pseudomonadota bacterium]